MYLLCFGVDFRVVQETHLFIILVKQVSEFARWMFKDSRTLKMSCFMKTCHASELRLVACKSSLGKPALDSLGSSLRTPVLDAFLH